MVPRFMLSQCEGSLRSHAIVLFNTSANHIDRKRSLHEIERMARTDSEAAEVLKQFKASGLALDEKI
jgi:hypothetical protein